MPTFGSGHRFFAESATELFFKAAGEENSAMPYCITLRARTDRRIITGWYDGSACRWSTDHRRLKLFDNKYRAGAVCRELRNLCPRNAEVINIEVAQNDPSSEVIPLTFSPFVEP